MKSSSILFALLMLTFGTQAQKTYSFDKRVRVIACGHILLQKTSNNLRYELLIELKTDSLPLSTEFDMEKYADAVNIHLNVYPWHNRYVHALCNDVVLRQAKKPTVYTGIKGYITINFWDKEKAIISLTLKTVLTVNGSGQKITLPEEHFDKIPIGWVF